MTDFPDRLSTERDSPHFNLALAYNLDVFVDNVFQSHAVEYCISEGWAKVIRRHPQSGQPVFSDGKYMTRTIRGKVVVKPPQQSPE